MTQPPSAQRWRSELQALVRLYHATDGNAIGLASITFEGLDQTWRDRVQRIRALPREAPRRQHMIGALRNLIEHTLWKQRAEIETLRGTDSALAAEAATIGARGGAAAESAMLGTPTAPAPHAPPPSAPAAPASAGNQAPGSAPANGDTGGD